MLSIYSDHPQPLPRAPRWLQRIALALSLLCLVPTGLVAGQGAEAGLPEVSGWSLGQPLLSPISEQAVVEHDGKVYILGGYPGDRIPVSNVHIYDPATNQWQVGPRLPIEVHHVPAASANGRLYLLGGEMQGAGTGLPSLYVNTVWELDPQAGEWVARAPMPTARGGGGAAVLDGKIYVAGGRPPGGSDFAVYDPATDRWTVLPDIPTQRNHVAVLAVNGRIHVIGGRFGGGFNSERTDVHEVYDPATNSWSTRAPMLAPRGGVAAVEANGCLFVIGGEGNYADSRGLSVENEAYNPQTDTWVSLPGMPTPTHGLVGAAFINGTIYLPGGSVTQGTATASSLHWRYRPTLTCR